MRVSKISDETCPIEKGIATVKARLGRLEERVDKMMKPAL